MTARTAHVKRIYRIDELGNIDTDVWVDVLRIDAVSIDYRGMNTDPQHTDRRYHFKWLDNGQTAGGDARNENANKSRRTQSIMLHNPEEPKEDTSNDIKLYLVAHYATKHPNQKFNDYYNWGQKWGFLGTFNNVSADGSVIPVPENVPSGDVGANPQTPALRKVEAVRVVHVDLGDFDMSSPVDWEDYKQALSAGTRDGSQFIDTEIVKEFHLNYGPKATDPLRQKYVYRMRNDDLADLIDVGGAGTPIGDSVPQLWRLDPLQAIVNVQWQRLVVTVTVVPDETSLTLIELGDYAGSEPNYYISNGNAGPQFWPPWPILIQLWLTNIAYSFALSVPSGHGYTIVGNPSPSSYSEALAEKTIPTEVYEPALNRQIHQFNITASGSLYQNGPFLATGSATISSRTLRSFSGDGVCPQSSVFSLTDPGPPYIAVPGFSNWYYLPEDSIPSYEGNMNIASYGTTTVDFSGITVTKGSSTWEQVGLFVPTPEDGSIQLLMRKRLT